MVPAESYALRFGADYCCSEYEEVLKDPEVDVVVIVSRNTQHASQALAALQAGKHVFLEKPMALTKDECRELLHAVAETGNQLTVGFNRRFSPTYLGLKRQLARRSGPAVLNLRVNSPGISGDYWMADPSIGGAILGEACHFVDLDFGGRIGTGRGTLPFLLPTGRKIPSEKTIWSPLFASPTIPSPTSRTAPWGARPQAGSASRLLPQESESLPRISSA